MYIPFRNRTHLTYLPAQLLSLWSLGGQGYALEAST